ncbi:MAG TPA: SpoIIE family protein phosphatase, partial [Acidimicrobiales bacterium]|nr:SpoIIE family protein phosphatase [Acidimicrobiales bacterium]
MVADRTGTIVYANDALTKLLGWRPEELVDHPVATLVPRRLLAAHHEGLGSWADGRTKEIDGRYLRLPALTPSGDEVPVGMVLSSVTTSTGEDVIVALARPRDAGHEQLNAVALELLSVLSAELEIGEAIDALLKAIGQRLQWDVADLWVVDPEREVTRVLGQWAADPSGLAEFLEASRDVTLHPGEGLPGRVWASGTPLSIERIADDPILLRQTEAERAGLTTAFAFPVEHDDVLVGVIELFRLRPEPIDVEHISVMADIGAQLGRHLGRVQAREHHRRAEHRQRLITAGIERLSGWLDYPAPLDDVCELLVPDVAEACVIDLVDDGQLVRLGEAYDTPEHATDVERLHAVAPIDTVSAGPMAAIRSRETIVYDEVDLESMAAGLPGVPRELLEPFADASTIIVPLVGRGASVGTMTLTRRGGRYDEEDRRFIEELGRHVGLAVANSQLFERERAVAVALQQSLLPPSLPEIEGLEVAARYEPGGTRLMVGGDFYDLFQADDGTWYALVGDVCGTGAEAAAITSQVRYTARALASRVDGPAELLDEVNAALLHRDDTRFCTALVVRLCLGDGGVEATLSSGGHPPAVLVSREGTRLVDCSGTLLGVYPDTRHEEVHLLLRPGEALAMYTDGVTETRDAEGRLLGEERLVEVLDACVEEHAEKTAA